MKLFRRRAFTLVEMLAVIAIIGILAGLVFPAIQGAREKAKMAKCANNLKQFGHAIDLYKIEEGDYPDFLSNLYPSYVSSKEMYLCPSDYCTQGPSDHRGADGGMPWWLPDKARNRVEEFRDTDDTKSNKTPEAIARRNSDEAKQMGSIIDYCSYLYEFCGVACIWSGGDTWKEARKKQMSGPSRVPGPIPLIGCFWHQKRKGDTDEYAKGTRHAISISAKERNIYYTDVRADRWW